MTIALLDKDDPPDAFPDPATASEDPEGLLAVGGDLSTARLLAAYRRGIFPWYEDGQPILWWCPHPRAVLVPDRLRISRSLRRRLRSDCFHVSVDLAFRDVIEACARSRWATGTWITEEMQAAYLELHALGHAHSIETWRGTELVGGLYGLGIGAMFFGESMFSRETDASKVALVKLARLAATRGIELIDCQVATAHLTSLGSELRPRGEFVTEVARLCGITPRAGSWREGPGSTSTLVPEDPLHG